ncbi:MAG: NAD(P)H-binding protein [Anaerolineae bacterium]|nr:NAD(P)H-binding protein [Anaerolineae bacterium]
MIVVTGATGFVGQKIVKRLLANGRQVRCFLAENKPINKTLWDPMPEIITGSLLDEELLFKTVTGADTIIHLENALWWGRTRDLERVELVGTRNLVAAARSARVGRIITLSHLGASLSSAFTLLRIKGMVEETVRTSGLAYTIIRSGILFGADDAFVNHLAMMLKVSPVFFFMPGRGEVVLHPLYIDDLVEVIFRSLEAIDTVDTTLDVGGPEYITLEDMVYTVMRVTDTPRFVLPVPPYILRWISGLYGRILPRSLMTSQWFDIIATNRTAPLGNMYNYFRIHPKRFEDTLLTYMPEKRYLWPMFRYSFRRRPRSI